MNRKKISRRSVFFSAAAILALSVCGCGDAPELTPSSGEQPKDLADLAVSLEAASEELPQESLREAQTLESGEEEGASGEPGHSESSQETAGQEETPSVVKITISAAGDVTLGTHQQQDYWNSFRQAYDEAEDESYFFANVYPVFSEDDMTLVNLEGPLTLSDTPREGQVYSIKGDPEYVNILTAGSVEAVSMGNNHTMDYLQQGMDDTVAAVEGAGIIYACEKKVGVYETGGVRIGMISVNEVSQGYLVEDTIQQGIAQLREEGVDLIFVSCHWGVEREYYPEDYQKILGEKCIDWGADLVIGHHPHVLQGIEEYKGRFILYSLGNFCFGANRNPPDKDTMIFQQTFTFVDGKKQEDQQVRVIPCLVSSVSERNNFQPTLAQGEEKARILERINEFSKDFGVRFDEDGLLTE